MSQLGCAGLHTFSLDNTNTCFQRGIGFKQRAREVQVGGNFFEALTKLKHAWDMWNSTPYLVTTDAYMGKVKQLVEGSFHEMGKALKIVNWRKIQELYDARKRVDAIESEISLA